MTLDLANVRSSQGGGMRVGTAGYSPDELVEVGVRALFLGEPMPERIGMLEFMTDPGINTNDLREAFVLPNEFAEAVVRLVVTEGLVGSGNAERVSSLALGPRTGQSRRIALAWEDPTTGVHDGAARRLVEGEWSPG